jgi:preprotein translocase subunit SecG
MIVFVTYIIPVIHVIACIFLIVVVLLQQGKGADVGALFGGGGSQSLFGASGAGNFLTRLTTGMAITFMATSLILTYGQTHAVRSGILDRIPAAVAPGATGTPAPTPSSRPQHRRSPPREHRPQPLRPMPRRSRSGGPIVRND